MAEVTTLVIHLYAGSDFKKWRDLETADLDGKESGLVILCLDVEKGHDLHNPHLMGFLEKFACDGRIAVLLGGPPCRTVSVARHRDDEGPRPVRGRGRYMPGGVFEQTPHKSRSFATMRCSFVVEGMLADLSGAPWNLSDRPSWRQFESYSRLRSTCLTGGMARLFVGPALRFQAGCHLGARVVARCRKAIRQKKSEWCFVRAPGALRGGALPDQPIREAIRSLAKDEAVTEKELVEWQVHVNDGHRPYRRDCWVCAEAMGRDRQLRRITSPQGFTLNVGLTGPYIPGKDQKAAGVRYVMGAAYITGHR